MFRIGLGYDSHRFADGRPLILGGVTIPHPQGLSGHSDGDAVAHALTDAILGAAGAGNIGVLFPDTDPRWKGADSLVLLHEAYASVRARGFRLLNVDVTVICEAPRIGPHVQAMTARLSDILEIPAASISVKGKTNEHMGFIGRGEGVAAIAVAALEGR